MEIEPSDTNFTELTKTQFQTNTSISDNIIAKKNYSENQVDGLEQTSSFIKVIGLSFRSIIGIGVLTTPYMHTQLGIIPSIILYPFFTGFLLLNMQIIPLLADKIEFKGKTLIELVYQITESRLLVEITRFTLLIMSLNIVFSSVYFSVESISASMENLGYFLNVENDNYRYFIVLFACLVFS